MNLKIRKDRLLEALDKMYNVSTKSIRSEYDRADRVTIRIESKKVQFISSNGHLDARWTITEKDDPNIVDENEPGSFTVKASKLREMVKSIPLKSASGVVMIDEDGDMIRVRDPSRKRRIVKLQKDQKEHKITFGKPKGDSHEFEKDLFSRAVDRVTPFMSTLGYKVKYLMLCFHFLKEETRFICGNGRIFAIFRFDDPNPNITDDAGIKYIIPCKQILLINSLLSDANRVTFSWDGTTKCYITLDTGLELVLKGIPSEEYIAYDSHAFRVDDAKAIVDIEISELLKATGVVDSCDDSEDKQNFLSCNFEALNDGEVGFVVDEGKYQCDISIPGEYYNLNDSPTFKSHYDAKHLAEVARQSHHEYLRFYCVEEEGLVIAQTVNLLTSKDESIPPEIKPEEDSTRLSFFWAAVERTEEEDG